MVTVKEDIDYFLNRKSINIDIGFRCSLECPKCQRQSQHKNLNEKVPGYDLTLDEIDKLVSSSPSEVHRSTGCYYVLTALVEVSPECAQTMPWLVHAY